MPIHLKMRDEERVPTYIETPNASLAQIEAAIRSLDGARHSDLSVSIGALGLVVGGGRDGRVVVTLFRNGGESWSQLLERFRGADEYEQLVGGQDTPLPESHYVALETALRAARYFVEKVAPDPDLDWDHTDA